MLKICFRSFLLTALVALCSCSRGEKAATTIPEIPVKVDRVEPPSWWVGMNTPLQILVHGEDVGSCDVCFEGLKGVKVKALHKADSPDYLFVDVSISPKAQTGRGTLVFKSDSGAFHIPYEIAPKPDHSRKKSFSGSDLVYLIVPDRYANADKSNDETGDTDDIYDLSDKNARHGGDIQGIIESLTYLEDLGVTAIWPTPLLEDNDHEVSYHGYACSNYYRIDPRFGSNKLYRDLVGIAHEHGIKMIMDVVTNHCGSAHPWVENPPLKDWIHRNGGSYLPTNHLLSSAMDPNASESERKVMEEGWFVSTMPDINLANPFVLNYFVQWAVWWVNWADLDGLRVDTWYYNDKQAMTLWAKAVREEFPWINIVGELWSLQPDFVAYWQEGHPNLDGFAPALPSVMDFPLMSAMQRTLASEGGDHGLAGTGDIQAVYDALSHDFNYADPGKLLIFFSNHDSARLADICGADPAKMKIGLTLLATLRGIPQLLYGEEAMLTAGTSRRDDGRIRLDFPARRKVQEAEMYAYSRKLFQWRKRCTAIHGGRTLHFVPEDDCYCYFRSDEKSTVMVFVNLSDKSVSIPWERFSEIASDLGKGRNPLTDEEITAGERVEAAPVSALVLEFPSK